MRTNIRITLVSPTHRASQRILQIHPFQPAPLYTRKLATISDVLDETIRPDLRIMVRNPMNPTEQLRCDTRIPHMMQIQLNPVEQDMNPIAAPRHILRVQRLVDIAQEVNHKLGSLVPSPQGQAHVEHLIRVVLDDQHDAARLLLAVTLEIDAAGMGRGVVRVNEVEVLGEVAPFCVADCVGPGCDAGHIRGRGVAEEVLHVGLGRGGDEGCGDVGYCDVPETCDGVV